ncbi:Hypothetical predicted protein, partial [Mytilus galloprovincialis]
VLAKDKSGKLYKSDRNLEKRTPVNEEAVENMNMEDVTSGNETKIWGVSPENDIALCDKNQQRKSEHPTNKIKSEKIYTNQLNEQVWAVDTEGKVNFRESENNPSWTTEAGVPKVPIGQGVVALDMKKVLWYRKVTPPNCQDNWEEWGSLSDIVGE